MVQEIPLAAEHPRHGGVVHVVVDDALHQVGAVVVLDEALPLLLAQRERLAEALLRKVPNSSSSSARVPAVVVVVIVPFS